MTTQEVANKYVEMCNAGQMDQIQQELYAESAASYEMEGIEGVPPKVEGMEALKAKGQHWAESVEAFHGVEVEGPIVAGDHFSCALRMDITYKGQERRKDEEMAMFQVKDGKIVAERFFYPAQ